MERKQNVDIAKGIAILFVIIGHCYSGDNISNGIFKIIYSFHMPLFFIISGILYSEKEKWGGSFSLSKKLHSFILPYFVFELLYSICISFSGGFVNLTKYLITTLTLYGVGATWFLPCLFFVELLFYFMKKQKQVRLLTVIICFILGLFLPFDGYWIVIGRCFIGIGFYAFGFYTKNYLLKKYKLYILLGSMIVVICTALMNSTIDLYSMQLGNGFLYITSSLAGSFSILCISSILETRKNFFLEIIKFYGRNTLIILCTHVFLIRLFQLLDARFFNNIFTAFGVFEGIVLGIIIAIIEIPIIKFSGKNLYFLFGLRKPNN